MQEPAFEPIQTHIQALYQQGEWAQALALATEALGQYPTQAPLLQYWRSSLLARLGDYRAAVVALHTAIEEEGFWYSDVLLRKSPAFKPLHGLVEFEELAARNRRLQEADRANTYPLLMLRSEGRCKAGGQPCPLLIALHGDIGTAQETLPFWQAAPLHGWLVAAPQSSQAIWKDAFVWDDRDLAARELASRYGALVEQYAVDPGEVALAGIAQGGELAAWLTLKSAIPVRGFVAVNPTGALMEDADAWEALVRENSSDVLRSYFILGEEASAPRAPVERLAKLLDGYGLPCQVEIVPAVGSGFDPAYADALLRALDFLLEE